MTSDTVKVGQTKVDFDTRVQLPVSVPLGMRIALDKAASERGVEMGDIARQAIAEAIGYTGDLGHPTRGRQKTLTDEQKKAEAKRRAEERRDAVEQMLKAAGVEVSKRKRANSAD